MVAALLTFRHMVRAIPDTPSQVIIVVKEGNTCFIGLTYRNPAGSKFHPAGFFMSIKGAIILVFLAKLIS